jgi:uncharacterized protein YacL
MGRRIARFFIVLVGVFVGPGIAALVFDLLSRIHTTPDSAALLPDIRLLIYIGAGVLSGIIFLFLSKPMVKYLFRAAGEADKQLSKLPAGVVLSAVFGLILGLVVAILLTQLVNNILQGIIGLAWLAAVLNVIIYIVCVYLGISILVRHRPEFLDSGFRRGRDEKGGKDATLARPKLLDTSVIIDGRIFDICNTGILEGALIIPEFVLDELRHIADSADDLKRNRGRRGLDVLKRIQTELNMPVKIVHAEVEASDVDAKLLFLAKKMDGIVVTNDFNLNKVAAVKGVRVLNINELSNAVKPVVLPGEDMLVNIVKDGKEPGQGIAYLDDGTMIVVEGGQNEHNRPVGVVVTSVIQTAAGRMIFAKLK